MNLFKKKNTEEQVASPSEKKNKLFSAELKRKLKYGSLSVVFTALVIAAVIVCNILVDLIASKIPETSIDTTDKQYYELSEESIDYLKTLKDYEIDITFIGEQTVLLSNDYYNKIVTLAEKYEVYAPKLNVSYVDVDKNPAFAAKYDDIDLAVGDAIVSCGERYRQLTENDFIYIKEDESNQDEYYGEETTDEKNYSLNAEYALSTAIMVVTASDNPKATIITGHGEQMPEKLTLLLENNGYTVSSQSIINDLDYNSNLIVIAAPSKDYSEADLKKLDDFLFNDGKYGKNIMYIADYTQPVLPNIEAFLGDWGFLISEGVVYESDDSLSFAGNPELTPLRFIDSELTLNAALSEISSYGEYGKPAKIASKLDGKMENSIILQHTETAKVGTATAEGFNKGEGEGYPYVAMSRTTLSKYSEDVTVLQSSVLFVNSLGFFEGDLFERAYFANSDITIAAVDSMLGRDNELLLPMKSLTSAALGITYEQANIIGCITAVVIPALLLIVCLVICIRRRFL